MDIFYMVMRVLLVVIASSIAIIYAVLQLWQRIPSLAMQFKSSDFIIYSVVGFLFGVGTNTYWGLGAFVPLILIKFLSHKLIAKNKVRGSGRWMEVEWRKFTPRGFQLPKEALDQIQKIPGNTHVLVPRFVSLFAVKYLISMIRKNAGKVPAHMRGQEDQAFSMIERMGANVRSLGTGKTEKMSLPFGELKITRL